MAGHSVHPLSAALGSASIDSPTDAAGFARRSRGVVLGLLAVGAATLLAGLWLAPARTAVNLFLNSYCLTTMGLGAICFVAIHYAAGAQWNVAIRRVPEALAGIVLPGVVGLFVVFLGFGELYSWRTEELAAGTFKALWLNWPFFLVRAAVFAGCWLLLIRAIVGRSRRQDDDGDVGHTFANRRLSALFIVVFGVTFWLASFDWIMSLEPHWYSTLFAIYNFSGLFLTALAAITILVIFLSRSGPLRFAVHDSHLHDLGKLIFAFSTFWMYIWFSQYMLIWYAGIPEETAYFVRRTEGAWMPLFLMTMVLNWAVPFAGLLSKKAKMDRVRMVQIAGVILVGRWLDLYVMIFPAVTDTEPMIGLWEVGLAAGGLGVLLWAFFRQLQKAPLVPVRDPLLEESLSGSH